MLAWLFCARVPKSEYDAMKAHYEKRVLELEALVAQTVTVITAQMSAVSEDARVMQAIVEKMALKNRPDKLN